MEAALQLTFNLALAGVTWSGALIALIASKQNEFCFRRTMTGLHVLSLTGAIMTLGAVIGETPRLIEGQTAFPALVVYGGRLQWSFFILAIGLLAFNGFAPPGGQRGAIMSAPRVTRDPVEPS